ncbi:EamA-like transporter family [Seminavis robusta]|uniref:EamA-like transporter family n=1 Tax=Seminavis robusta TaxID=568900 RepID=A0A9N8DJ00_9STRA|nr:EamA-like transporter family [Seminavis robusta]|eukprot:Sro109_g054400.1 EamA-like transporter family (433) ;mRNA; f:7518-8995
MYQKLKRQLQRRLSSTSSLDANGGSTSGSSGSSKKPLLPETTKDTVRTIPPSSGNFSSNFGDTGIPAHAYVTLATAVIALSSVGPSFDLQHGVAPILKVYWRMTGTWIVLLIPTILAVAKDGWPKLNRQQAITFLGASFCYAVMGVGFVLSLEYTSVGNAVIFSNTNALILLFGRFLIGSPISALESGGSAVAFLGGILCTYDQAEAVEATAMPASESSVAEVAPIWQGILGDVIAVIAAAGGCCYLVLASTVRARFPSLYTFMFSNMLIGSQITLLCIVISGQEIEFSRDVHIGLFGFLSFRYDRLPLEMFLRSHVDGTRSGIIPGLWGWCRFSARIFGDGGEHTCGNGHAPSHQPRWSKEEGILQLTEGNHFSNKLNDALAATGMDTMQFFETYPGIFYAMPDHVQTARAILVWNEVHELLWLLKEQCRV